MKKIAIVGSGQLAQMMANAGKSLGLSFSFLAEQTDDTACVDGLGKIVRLPESQWKTKNCYEALGEPDVITVEKEHVNVPLLESLEQFCKVAPNPRALNVLKNRLREKKFLVDLGIPVAPFYPVKTCEEAVEAFDLCDNDGFLKSCEEGYDGYNQWRITPDTRVQALEKAPFPSDLVMEKAIHFDCELSFIAACSANEIKVYPAAQNEHRDSVLFKTQVPAPKVNEAIVEKAQWYIQSIAKSLDYHGILSIECFLVGDDLLVNEIAPRVHNSGHWTLDGARTSQFENHIRAILGLPLGNTACLAHAGMLNILGKKISAQDIIAENTYFHWYGKTPRMRRKLGHINVLAPSEAELHEELNRLENIVYQNQ